MSDKQIDDGQTLYLKQQSKLELMHTSINQMASCGQARARLQKDYRIKLRMLIAKERDKGTAASLAQTIAKGDKSLAELEEQMEVATVKYEMHNELIMAYKLEANILENQIQREWGRK